MDRLKQLASLYNNGELDERGFISAILAKISMITDINEIGRLVDCLLKAETQG